jgi:hypothetical protein
MICHFRIAREDINLFRTNLNPSYRIVLMLSFGSAGMFLEKDPVYDFSRFS